MDAFAVNKPAANRSLECTEFISFAERELAAFYRAVTELFGAQQAEFSAEDWLQELQTVKDLPHSPREWRLITAKVISRLANRLNALIPITEPAI